MPNKSFQQFLDSVTARDSRYAAGAYIFVRMALDYTVKKLRSADANRVGGNISSLTHFCLAHFFVNQKFPKTII